METHKDETLPGQQKGREEGVEFAADENGCQQISPSVHIMQRLSILRNPVADSAAVAIFVLSLIVGSLSVANF